MSFKVLDTMARKYSLRAQRQRIHRAMNFAFANIVGIAICGLLGGIAAWALVQWLDITGVAGALIAVFAGMVIATAAFALGIALLRALGWLK